MDGRSSWLAWEKKLALDDFVTDASTTAPTTNVKPQKIVVALLWSVAACGGASGPGDCCVVGTDAVSNDAATIESGLDVQIAEASVPSDVANLPDLTAPDTQNTTPDVFVASDTVVPDGSAGNYFPSGTPWDRDVSSAPVDSESTTVIQWLESNGGFGTGRLQIDFSMEVLEANASTPMQSFTPTGDFYSPDCDRVPVPIPVGGALEGEQGYACESDGDCHLIVHHRPSNRLYEMWRADLRAGTFRGGCLAVWDTSRRYPLTGRGEQCTSADAAGFPIAPLLFSADEVSAGEIRHAIRFILPNPRMRRGIYVRPATHAGAPSGPMQAPPYGVRFRLRSDFPLASLPNNGARVVARALQRYGMLLADGGNIALTAQSDRFTRAKWAGLLGARDLQSLRVSDFQMVEAGERIRVTNDCVRNP